MQEDYDTYLIITEVFCELHDLPFNKIAAEKSALSESEVGEHLKNKKLYSEKEIENATVEYLKENYLKHLKEHTN